MKKIYKTKKRKKEFRVAYMKIGDLNLDIVNLEIERDCFIRHENWAEAIDRQNMIHECWLQLLEMGKAGWDISYTSNQCSGHGVTRTYPELK